MGSRNTRKAIVLDTSAFIAGFNPSTLNEKLFSVPEVGEELAAGTLSKLRFSSAADGGTLKILEPEPRYVEMVKQASKEIGDLLSLSEADMRVLALAMQLKHEGWTPTVVTDDYSMQNVAEKIGVHFTPLITFGIRYYLHWTLYCPACRREYPPDYKHQKCEICGTRLKRKPRTKTLIKNHHKPE